MSGGGVQIPLGDLPLDPRQLVTLSIDRRIALYTELGLAPEQREAAEAAVRLIVADKYRRAR